MKKHGRDKKRGRKKWRSRKEENDEINVDQVQSTGKMSKNGKLYIDGVSFSFSFVRLTAGQKCELVDGDESLLAFQVQK